MKKSLIPVFTVIAAAILVACSGAKQNDKRGTSDDSIINTPQPEAVSGNANTQAGNPAKTMPSGAAGVSTLASVEKGAQSGMAPDFSWTAYDGKTHSLKEYRGKTVLLNFWGTWCPPCRRELPDIVKIRAELMSKNFEVIGLNVNEQGDASTTAEASVMNFAQSHGIEYPLIISTEELGNAYGGIEAVPTTFIVDKTGKIVDKLVGAQDEATLRASIAKAG